MPSRGMASLTNLNATLIPRSCGTNTPTCKGDEEQNRSRLRTQPGRERTFTRRAFRSARSCMFLSKVLCVHEATQPPQHGWREQSPSPAVPQHEQTRTLAEQAGAALGPASVCWRTTAYAGTDPFRVGYHPRPIPARFINCRAGRMVAPDCRTSARAPPAPGLLLGLGPRPRCPLPPGAAPPAAGST